MRRQVGGVVAGLLEVVAFDVVYSRHSASVTGQESRRRRDRGPGAPAGRLRPGVASCITFPQRCGQGRDTWTLTKLYLALFS